MHHKSLFSLASLLTSASLATAASVEIFPLASSFDDYIPPTIIELAGLTVESHRLGLNSNNMEGWNDYTFVINEYDRNDDILRQSLCEASEVASMTDKDDEMFCFYTPRLDEMLGSLSLDDIEDIQMEYSGMVEDFPVTSSSGDDIGKGEEDEENLVGSLRQTVSLRFGPATGKFDFVVSIVGEDGTVLGAINITSDEWPCNEPTQSDPSQTRYCIWEPSNRNDRRVVLPVSRPSRH